MGLLGSQTLVLLCMTAFPREDSIFMIISRARLESEFEAITLYFHQIAAYTTLMQLKKVLI